MIYLKVLTPQKFGDIYLYDLPPGSQPQRYDVPPTMQDSLLQAYDIPRALSREGSESRLSVTRRYILAQGQKLFALKNIRKNENC